MTIHPTVQQKYDIIPVLRTPHVFLSSLGSPQTNQLTPPPPHLHPTTSTLVCHLTFPHPIQDWLWGTPITSSDGTKVLVTTGCSRGYCRCQLWYTGDKTECRFTVSQDLAQRDQQCTCNRQGKVLMSYYKTNLKCAVSLCLRCALSLSLSTTGFLCGSCVNGTGLTSLLNRCEACDTANVTLIALLGNFGSHCHCIFYAVCCGSVQPSVQCLEY